MFVKLPKRRDDDPPWALGLAPATASNTAGDSAGDQGAVALAKLLEELLRDENAKYKNEKKGRQVRCSAPPSPSPSAADTLPASGLYLCI
jgi:hypothetical protein